MSSPKLVPDPNGAEAKIGDQVKITSGELAGMIGEVVGFVEDGKNWIQTIKVVREDGKVEFVEVKNLTVELFMLVDKIGKSTAWKKFVSWLKKVFRKKKKNKGKE